MTKCPACPVKGDCYGPGPLPHLCGWAASGDPHLVRSVVDRHAFPPPGEAPKAPGLLARAANLATAVASHVAAGLPTLDADAVAARLAVCDGCPQRLPGGVCAGCGCHLATKARWADQDCPEGKWPDA